MSRRFSALVWVLFFIYPNIATAQGEHPELETWHAQTDMGERVSFLYRRHKILLTYDEANPFTSEDVEAFITGANTLPRKLVRAIGVPIKFERRSKSCLFGIGRYSRGCPSWVDDAFQIYDIPPLQGEGQVTRLSTLNGTQRQSLQRQRAVVHAMMHVFDRKKNWSARWDWRALNGWRSDRRADNRDAWGFSRYLGQTSPRLDLVTFAEAYFIRPGDQRDADGTRVWNRLDRDLSLWCQEFTRRRFVSEQFAQFDPKWNRALPVPPTEMCPAFERWSNANSLEGIDVVVAAASADRPESLYGHLLLHLRYKGPSNGFEPVYQFGAVTPTDVSFVSYFSRGLFGGFMSVLEVNTYRNIETLFTEVEQRGLKRFELHLSGHQRRRVLERIWEMERRYRVPYLFFSDNCATFLMDLLGVALGYDFDSKRDFIVSPSDVLDALAEQKNGTRGRLVTKRPLIEMSQKELALQGVRSRRALLAKAEIEGDALESNSLRTRSAAYVRFFEDVGATDALTFEEKVELYEASIEVEFYFVQKARQLARQTRLRVAPKPKPKTAAALLAERRELFTDENLERRAASIFERTSVVDRALAEKPTRDLTAEEAKVLVSEAEHTTLYASILEAQATLISQARPEFDPVAFLETRRLEAESVSQAIDARSIERSGHSRIHLGADFQLDQKETVLSAGYALISERLGERRLRGFRPDIESQALALSLHVPISPDVFSAFELDLTVLKFLSIEQEIGPLKEGFFDTFGWGFDTQIGLSGKRQTGVRLDASGGLILPLFQSDAVQNFLVFGTYAHVGGFQADGGRWVFAGGDAFLRAQLHLYGSYANNIHLELHGKPLFEFFNLKFVYEVSGRLESQHTITEIAGRPLFLKPRVTVSKTNVDLARSDALTELFGGLSLEWSL